MSLKSSLLNISEDFDEFPNIISSLTGASAASAASPPTVVAPPMVKSKQ